MNNKNLLDRILLDFQMNGTIYNDNYISSGVRKVSARINDLKDLGYRFESYFTCSLGLNHKKNCCYIIVDSKDIKLTKQAIKNIENIKRLVSKFKATNLQISCKRVVYSNK